MPLLKHSRGIKWLIGGFQQCMRSLCLFLRSILKRLDYLLSQDWRSIHFTRINIRLVLLLFFLFLLLFSPTSGINTVHAQESTPTPTVYIPTCLPPDQRGYEVCWDTWESLYKTPTVQPTVLNLCNGQPVGWGVVTPDPYWLMNCNQCVTRTPSSSIPGLTLFPTNTPIVTGTINPTSTVQPSSTNTPAITNTPVPNHYWTSDWQSVGFTGTIQTCGTVNLTYVYSQFNRVIPAGSNDLRAIITEGYVSSTYLGYLGFDMLNTDTTSPLVFRTANKRSIVGTAGTTQTLCFESVSGACTFAGLSNSMTLTFNQANTLFKIYAAKAQGCPWQYSFPRIKYVYYGTGDTPPTPTPVPTFTPVPTSQSQCNVVLPERVVNPFDVLPNILIGPSECTQIGGGSIDLGFISNISWLSDWGIPEYITIPGFFLCTASIDLGVVHIFNLAIDLDIMAFVMAGVAIIRILFRS